MIPMLDETVEMVNEVFVQPRLKRLKARISLSLVTVGLLALFAFLGMLCLFLLAFLILSNAYDAQRAAGVLFGFCILICLSTLVVHAIAKHRLDRDDIEARFSSLPDRRSTRKPERDAPSVGELVQDFFAEHKGSALIAVAVAGVILGARPGLAFKAVSWALRRKARSSIRD